LRPGCSPNFVSHSCISSISLFISSADIVHVFFCCFSRRSVSFRINVNLSF
jgi:hypothetical protein